MMWTFLVMTVMVMLIDRSGVTAQPTPFSNLPANVTIPENTPPGEKIFTVNVMDAMKVMYSFDSKTTADTFEVVRSESGLGYYVSVKCEAKLDFENPKHTYSIAFSASISLQDFDESRFARQTERGFGPAVNLSISLSDINEAPVFNSSMYFLSVAEKTGDYLPKFVLLDEDDGDDNATFEIVSVYPPGEQKYFQMENATGKLSLPLGYDVDDNNQPDAVLLTIAAKDKGQMSGMTFLLVNIFDINDNAPGFSQKQQTVTVPQNLAVKSAIVSMQACDKDSGNNGKIKYNLQHSEFSKYFEIDNVTGVVTSTQTLPAVAKSMSTELLVVASDHGSPAALVSTATITVNIVTNTVTPPTNPTVNIRNTDKGSGDKGEVIYSTTTSCVEEKSCDVCKALYEVGQCKQVTITKKESVVDISFLYWLLPLLFVICTTIVIFIIIFFCVTKRKDTNNKITPREAIFAEANNNAKPKPILVKPAVSTINSNSSPLSIESVT